MKSILITSYFFYPEINPRAFRTFELAKEFARNGYNVDVVLPEMNYDYSEIISNYSIKIHPIKGGFFLNRFPKNCIQSIANKKKESLLFRLFKHFLSYIYLGGKSFEYSFTLYQYLKKLKTNYDIILSISVPISVHIGTSLFLRYHNKTNSTSIADCGDPFSFNPDLYPKCFYFKYLEKWILNPFNFITIPTPAALPLYTYFKKQDAIQIIPQSYDPNNIHLKAYKKNKIVTFAYAGIFYKSIRNPFILFEYLASLNYLEFKFLLYTNIDNPNNMELINPYIKKLGKKLQIYPLIPREECIYELSGMDFLVNQNNINEEQKPSKMIDYMLTKRPIFYFNQNNLNQDALLTLLTTNDYNNEQNLSLEMQQMLEDFSIHTIAKKFENLTINRT